MLVAAAVAVGAIVIIVVAAVFVLVVVYIFTSSWPRDFELIFCSRDTLPCSL